MDVSAYLVISYIHHLHVCSTGITVRLSISNIVVNGLKLIFMKVLPCVVGILIRLCSLYWNILMYWFANG